MAAYRRMNMLAGIQGIQGRDRPSRGLSAPLWSRYVDRVGCEPCEIAAIEEANSASTRRRRGGYPTPLPGVSPFVPASLTAHIQYGAVSTDAQRLMGATPTTGTKLKAPPVSDLPDGAFICLVQTS